MINKLTLLALVALSTSAFAMENEKKDTVVFPDGGTLRVRYFLKHCRTQNDGEQQTNTDEQCVINCDYVKQCLDRERREQDLQQKKSIFFKWLLKSRL